MSSFTTLDTNGLLPGEAWTSAKALAVYENLLAFMEQDITVPVNIAAQHPYDMSIVGDGEDGLIWDFAVAGGVSSITSPDFEAGFTYTFSIENVAPSVASDDLQIKLYDSSLSLVGTKALAGGLLPGSPVSRLTTSVNYADAHTGLTTTNVAAPRVPCRRAVLDFAAGRSFGEGKVYLRRQFELI